MKKNYAASQSLLNLKSLTHHSQHPYFNQTHRDGGFLSIADKLYEDGVERVRHMKQQESAKVDRRFTYQPQISENSRNIASKIRGAVSERRRKSSRGR